MTEQDRPAGRPPQDGRLPAYDPQSARISRLQRRRDKIAAEIDRNRRGEYTVPTWVLVLILLALLGAVAAVALFA